MIIQDLLFKINKWTIYSILQYLAINNIKYRSYRITSNYYRFRIQEPNYNIYNYRIARNYKIIIALIIEGVLK